MGDRDDPVLAYWKWLMTLPMPWQWPWDDFSKREDDRRLIHDAFPNVVTIEQSTDELIKLEEWCWQEFGQKNGTCRRKVCGPIEEAEPSLKPHEQHYLSPKKNLHTHTGTWTTVWALKTSYEDGFCDFCFYNSEDAVFFKLTFGFNN